MKKTELLMLADFIEAIPDEGWDFNIWAERPKGTNINLGECGTVGCALGYTAILFPNSFFLHWRTYGDYDRASVRDYRGEANLYAASLFFEISQEKVARIFTMDGYHDVEHASQKMVAENIREIVASDD
jgi:hypothetical protein